MSNIHEWDVAAANNNSAAPDGAPEGMLAAKVNDTLREMMASLARWYQDNRMGSLVSAWSSNTYTLTSNQTYAALADIAVVTFRVDRANTGAATLNIDSLGAKAWQKRSGVAYSSGDLIADQTVMVAYNATNDTFETIGGAAGEFDSGDSLLEMQTTASLGWTKDTTAALDESALRLVVGTAGSKTDGTDFTSVLTARTIAQANLPNATLSGTTANGGVDHSHSTTVGNTSLSTSMGPEGSALAIRYGTNGVWGSGGASAYLHAHSLTTSSINGGVTQTTMDFAVNYRDVIKVDKD